MTPVGENVSLDHHRVEDGAKRETGSTVCPQVSNWKYVTSTHISLAKLILNLHKGIRKMQFY
jgi:hypothetical protein